MKCCEIDRNAPLTLFEKAAGIIGTFSPLIGIALVSLLCGCVDASSYKFDREHFRDRLNTQSHRIYQLEKDMIQLKRGYTFVPVKVMITNRTEVAR